MTQPALILASTSRYRRELLERLGLAFGTASPGIDETPNGEDPPPRLATRLARAKASAIAHANRDAWVLGSDQVAELDGRVLGKPGDHSSAVAQLRACAGRSVRFHTAFCLMHAGSGRDSAGIDLTVVHFRHLDEEEIGRYLARDQPYDCAGSFKAERLGITLFSSIESQDPTALVGLPLIAVAQALREAGFALP